ncbi:IS3 family transposase [Corynebacterium auris]|uniref:IS3 family transposase n=1 Tax=Corynebacterium auris TaxID=44750 RepID=UPI0025B52289|nr:IS3 family transposase [Corynebacterium auris]
MRAQREAAMLDPSVVKHDDLRRWVNDFADSHRRWGYRRAYVAALDAGYDIGRDAFRRLWRKEQLLVTPRTLRKRVCATTPIARVSPADHPGHVWALDFQFDSDYQGRRFKICNVIDEFTRQHVTFKVDRSIDAASVVELLDLAVLDRGAPKVLRMDNGPEFIAAKLQDWAEEHKCVQAFIPPGQPWHNGFVESFHNRMRDEVLEDNLFDDVEQARQIIGFWSKRYNDTHPHSSLGYMSPNRFAVQWRKENTTAATQATRS